MLKYKNTIKVSFLHQEDFHKIFLVVIKYLQILSILLNKFVKEADQSISERTAERIINRRNLEELVR